MFQLICCLVAQRSVRRERDMRRRPERELLLVLLPGVALSPASEMPSCRYCRTCTRQCCHSSCHSPVKLPKYQPSPLAVFGSPPCPCSGRLFPALQSQFESDGQLTSSWHKLSCFSIVAIMPTSRWLLHVVALQSQIKYRGQLIGAPCGALFFDAQVRWLCHRKLHCAVFHPPSLPSRVPPVPVSPLAGKRIGGNGFCATWLQCNYIDCGGNSSTSAAARPPPLALPPPDAALAPAPAPEAAAAAAPAPAAAPAAALQPSAAPVAAPASARGDISWPSPIKRSNSSDFIS